MKREKLKTAAVQYSSPIPHVQRRFVIGTCPQLYVITDTTIQHSFTHLQLAEFAIRGGADFIQFRETRKIGTGELLRIVTEIQKLCRRHHVKFLINNRVDLALAADADGVHLGREDLPIAEARKILGRKIIGASAGNLEEALQAEKEGSDYLGFGHIFPTSSKAKETPPAGIALLKKVCQAVKIPVFAVGGITRENLEEVKGTGAAGIAVIQAVCGAKNPEEAARILKKSFYEKNILLNHRWL